MFYVGHSGELEKRIRKHNEGLTKPTKSGIPWVSVYHEEYQTRSEALKREYEIKRWKSRKMIEKLISDHASICHIGCCEFPR